VPEIATSSTPDGTNFLVDACSMYVEVIKGHLSLEGWLKDLIAGEMRCRLSTVCGWWRIRGPWNSGRDQERSGGPIRRPRAMVTIEETMCRLRDLRRRGRAESTFLEISSWGGLYKVAQTIWCEDCEIEIKASSPKPMAWTVQDLGGCSHCETLDRADSDQRR
jgi:hypothetical protein